MSKKQYYPCAQNQPKFLVFSSFLMEFSKELKKKNNIYMVNGLNRAASSSG